MCKEAGEDGDGGTENPPTGTSSPGCAALAHAKGRQETGRAVQSVAASPHAQSPSDPAGSGVHGAAAPRGGSLSADGGAPGPGRRSRGEGPGPSPRPASRRLLASGRSTGVGCPGPGPPRACSPEATSGAAASARTRGRRRRGLPGPRGCACPPPPPPPPRASAGRRALPHHRGPRRRPGGFGGPRRRRRRRGSATLPLAVRSAFPRLPLPSPCGPEPRAQARKRPGPGEGVLRARPRGRSRPRTRRRDTAEPGTMADAAWLPASASLRGLLSTDCTGGARGAGPACARRRPEGRGPRVTKRSRPRDPALCDARARNRNWPAERKKPSASEARGRRPRGPAHGRLRKGRWSARRADCLGVLDELPLPAVLSYSERRYYSTLCGCFTSTP